MTVGQKQLAFALRSPLLVAALLWVVSGSGADLQLVSDREPNDAPHEAVEIALPNDASVLRIVGELGPGDQDAYRFVVDTDSAGRRFDLELQGLAGALTRLELFDFSDVADGWGRIPETLAEQPRAVWTLASIDGMRAARAEQLLLSPGVYVLGVSHSLGEGAYALEIVEHDDQSVHDLGEQGSMGSPYVIKGRRPAAVWATGERQFQFDVAEATGTGYWDLTFQTAAGSEAGLAMYEGSGNLLLEMTAGKGLPSSRRGLALAPGSYRLTTNMTSAGVQIIQLAAAAPSADGDTEREPNDRMPNRLGFGQRVSGIFDDNDRETLEFEVDSASAAGRFDLALRSESGSSIELCLERDDLRLSHCARGDGLAELVDLGLTPGRYQLRLQGRGRVPTPWQLEWHDQGEVRAGEEVEPNDDAHLAVGLHEGGFGRGRFVGRETDHWRFSIIGEPQLWRLQLSGDDLKDLALYDSGAQLVQRQTAGDGSRVRLDNLFLMPGEYLIAASGTNSEYVLRQLALGEPSPGMELEPNDDYQNAARIVFGRQYTGTLAEADDRDRYRFLLSGYERVRLRVEPPVDGGIRGWIEVGDYARTVSDIRNGNRPGEPLEWDLFLPPGDYALKLEPGQTSDAEYTVLMERLDFLEAVSDREPNNARDLAAPVPLDGVVAGRVGETAAHEDWYFIDPLETSVRIGLPRVRGIRVRLSKSETDDDDLLTWDDDAESLTAELAANQRYWLVVEGDGDYRFELPALRRVGDAPPSGPLDVSIELHANHVQAFSRWRQRLHGELMVSNTQAVSRAVEVHGHLTDLRWRLEIEDSAVKLGPQARAALPFEIIVPPDAAAHPPVQLSFRVDEAGTSTGARTEITADNEAPPVAPVFHWRVPEPIRGGLNAAHQRFDAVVEAGPHIDAKQLETVPRLFDGMVRVGHWAEVALPTQGRTRDEFPQPTVRLAGNEPVPVRGFLLHPGASLSPLDWLHGFAIALSADGERFERVLNGTLDPMAVEQAFLLDQPVMARYARLIPLTTAFGDASSVDIRVGEFKVVAEPGWRPAAEPFNLAAPANGGHLVWADPWLRGSTFDRSMLIADGEAEEVSMRHVDDAELVLGMHHRRAARIAGVSVLLADTGRPDQQPQSVKIAVSTDSPVGPFEPIGGFALVEGRTRFDLDSPVWARYVRFTLAAAEGANSLILPDRIMILEAVDPDSGATILGEWGHYGADGPMETVHPVRYPGEPGGTVGRSRSTASALQPRTMTAGSARLDAYSSWFRLDVPEARNRLALTLRGLPTLEAEPRLVSDSGQIVQLHATEKTPSLHRWHAYVTPGERYFLEISEPPRSVLFSWDSSGSVSTYRPLIANTLLRYAEDLKPGRDEVNLLPFGYEAPILKDWLGHSYPLRRLLTEYPHDASSSAAESALAAAARALADRPGKKAVLFVTDAATSTDAGLWPALKRARPQIFALALSAERAQSATYAASQDLMQDWAQVHGGTYEYVSGVAALDVAFERVIARLRRPVRFEVEADFEEVDSPSPATIEVVAGPAGLAAGSQGAIEIILDASGSMLKQLDGKRRIDIAKAAIRRVVADTLTADIPFALRAYGHREAGSCRTDLEIPLGPLNKTEFFTRLEQIQAINLAKTPIADSLASVSSDLGKAKGAKRVVLLTDGEETCDGDVPAVLERLKQSGVDLRLNIVGFALDDDALKRTFREWAALAGGHYFDASAADDLADALGRAMEVPFSVIDSSGREIANGLVGDPPVSVPPGRFTVVVQTASPQITSDIAMAPGDNQTITVE